jgi:chemotaxis protein methyltransferase CheR
MQENAIDRAKSEALVSMPVLYDHEFEKFRSLLYRLSGIALSSSKKPLVCSRLGNRLRNLGLKSYSDYFHMISAPKAETELQLALDLLTTNETHFFREPKHFEYLRRNVLVAGRRLPMRIWSAACSSGEEPYTLAMLLDEAYGEAPWEIVGSDLSTRVLERARQALYPEERAHEIPQHYLSRYCLKGQGSKKGLMLIEKKLRDRVRFMQHNLTMPPPALGGFDVIFLRNVLIYFDQLTKRQVVSRLLPQLKPGGFFFISHSENLNDVTDEVEMVASSIFRKPFERMTCPSR